MGPIIISANIITIRIALKIFSCYTEELKLVVATLFPVLRAPITHLCALLHTLLENYPAAAYPLPVPPLGDGCYHRAAGERS